MSCAALARDEQGRPMRFSNETILAAGFIAEVDDNGTWRREAGGLPSRVERAGIEPATSALQRRRSPS
jgi:hypothetical protein